MSKSIAGAFALTFVLTTSAFAQRTPTDPEYLANGTVRVPAFELPPSSLMSKEAADALKQRSTRPKLSDAGLTIEQARANLEKYVLPDVEAAKKRYPVDITPKVIAGVKTRIVTPKEGEADKSRVLINLHGGAFNRCADGCALVESIPIASVGRFKVITVDYREGPENVFPAASEDVAAVYQDLLKTYKPENVGVYGCSAGGALTAQFGAWVVDKKLPTPGAFGMFSAGGLRGSPGDSYYVTHYTEGSMPAPGTVPASTGPKLRSYFEGADLKSALVSPALHPDVLAKFPPTLLITGSRSFDMSPVIYTHAQLLKAGVRAQLIVGEAMEHCYINHSDWPEARDAYDAIVRFFNDNLGKRG